MQGALPKPFGVDRPAGIAARICFEARAEDDTPHQRVIHHAPCALAQIPEPSLTYVHASRRKGMAP